jgi:hypothetical protein
MNENLNMNGPLRGQNSNSGKGLITTSFGVGSTRQNSGGGGGTSSDPIIVDTSKKILFEFTVSDAGSLGYTLEIIEV